MGWLETGSWGKVHSQSSRAAPSQGHSSQGPAAPKQRGGAGLNSQTQPLMAAPVPSNSLMTVVPSLHTTALEGGIPTPKEGWHQGTPHHRARDVRREGTVPGSVRQRPVGGGLRPPLSPWVPLHHLTREQGRWVNLSTFPTIFKPAEHRTGPCMVTAVSKQPGPGPWGPCRRQLGPAEGPR